jgi:AraC-like DNA-binding protein
MHPNTHFSALSSWVLLIAKAIDSYGCNSEDLFKKAGLEYARLREPVARFSFPAVARLWLLATETTEDPCFGLTVASFWHPTTLHALGYSWLASNNLEEAFERAVRYTRIVNTAASGILRIEKSEHSYCLIIDSDRLNPHPVPATIDAALAMLLIMCRAAYGENFRPLRVSVRRVAPDCANRFSEFFEAPVAFSQAENAMWLDPEMVCEPLATANPELVRINDRIVTDYLAQLDRGDVTMRVKSKLIECLPGGQISEEGIASSINVSRRSLQRRLREQGMTFTQLLENMRRDLGLQYVRDPQHSINEIAFLLGFAEPGNFSRAFKRWYGKSPSQYRQDSLA